jgi:hypothetical protein
VYQRLMAKLRTVFLCTFALISVVLPSGCASKGESESSMTWSDRWKAMRQRQDAAAAANVSTDADFGTGR